MASSHSASLSKFPTNTKSEPKTAMPFAIFPFDPDSVATAMVSPPTRSQFTAQDTASVTGLKSSLGYVRVVRNQGIVDQRTKDITAKLKKKHHNRKIDQMVERIDVQMQKLLETQDPDNEELYDKFAEKREMYLSQKM